MIHRLYWSAFINADLKEEVYMECPDGYKACEHCGTVQLQANKVCSDKECSPSEFADGAWSSELADVGGLVGGLTCWCIIFK